MTTILALVRDAEALSDLRTRFADQAGNGVASLGDRFGVFAGGAELRQQLQDSDEVLATIDETALAALGGVLDRLPADPDQATTLATTLLGPAATGLDQEAVGDLSGWLAQFAPSVRAATAFGASTPMSWTTVGPCYNRPERPRPVPPNSPLRAARFAGDRVLEDCLAGRHRMRAPEQGRAVLKIQAALLDLGFALPRKGADGHFGPETGAAVTAFKTREGLHPTDAVVGSKTMRRLDQLFAS